MHYNFTKNRHRKKLGAITLLISSGIMIVLAFQESTEPNPEAHLSYFLNLSSLKPSPLLEPMLDPKRPMWLRDLATFEINFRTQVPESAKRVLEQFTPLTRKGAKLHLELEVIDSQKRTYFTGKNQTIVTVNYLFTDIASKDRVFEFASQIMINTDQ